jgi:hypothetical protein
MKRYPFWSYLNISAIDAPLISVAWYYYFVEKLTLTSANVQYCLILGFSVWLGYMADRLFDIRFKKNATFASLRHQFCKKNEFNLWILWTITLIITVVLSLYTLNNDKIVAGCFLVCFILVYNLLNQYFSQKRFPKEIFVAAIFAYGTLFLLEGPINLNALAQLGLICFLNCLILTHKEKEIDNRMGVSSLTQIFSHRFITIIAVLSCAYCLVANQGILNPFFATSFACTLLHSASHRFNEEPFRLILESLYAVIPAIALICY